MSSLYTRLKITFGSANADAEALAALRDTDTVRVSQTGKLLTFKPRSAGSGRGVILYPGGRCDARGYAPLAQSLAAAGHAVFVPTMPLRLAVLDPKRAATLIAAEPAITAWHLGGHSMGGAMAAAFACANREQLAGLFFIASYPAAMHAMADATLSATMIYGTHDFITRRSEFEAAHERLPAHTRFVAVTGGDHYQFGSFAGMEVTATITRAEQQAQTVAALLEHLQKAD